MHSKKQKAPPKPRAHSQSPPPSNPRIFDLQAYHPGVAFSSSLELSASRELTLYDEDTHITSPLFYDLAVNDEGEASSLKIGEPKEDEVIVCIAGVYHKNGQDNKVSGDARAANGRAASGIFFGPSSAYNIRGKLPHNLRLSIQTAELNAVRAALRIFTGKVLKKRKTVNKLVIVTHSQYVVDGLTKNVWKWEEAGYVTTRGIGVVDEALYKEIQTAILVLEGKDISVQFWEVKKSENRFSVRLAESAFETDNLGSDANEEENGNDSAAETSTPKVTRSSALTFWLNEAGNDPRAQALCTRATIEMSLLPLSASASTSALVFTSAKASDPEPASLDWILERLICLGLDTPDSFELLFGPEWKAGIQRVLTKKRATVVADEDIPELI